ncbi:MAG: DUF1156 domain-containing protein [Solirubrobacterales bacterium]
MDSVTGETYKKKLIEVALPLDVINAESAREKSIRHGHPSTMHLWWARRPLAACRAVLFAQLVDDPSAHPERFPTEDVQDAERERLFRIIEDLVKWENSTDETVLEAARAEIRRSCGGDPPAILDPFAGGGSIPLEAQRLGLEAYASDLNPVAVLINKALIEIPPRWADCPPVNPDAENRTRWKGAEGLAEDVRRYGQWIRDEADRRIGHLYPKVTLQDGSNANVIAWIWARTITCPNPACGAEIPLLSTFWLGKKKGKEARLQPVTVEGRTTFRVVGGGDVERDGNAGESGVLCFSCRENHSLSIIRPLAREHGTGARLVATVAEGSRRRHYLAASDEDEAIARSACPPDDFPTGAIPDQALGFRVAAYGLEDYSDLFTARQAELLGTLFNLCGEARLRIEADAAASGVPKPTDYARDVGLYLGLGISRFSGRSSTLCIWLNQPKNEGIANVFTRPTLSMNWDFAEANPFSSSSGNLLDNFAWISRVIDRSITDSGEGHVSQSDARDVQPTGMAISTDPPYYDNVGYADLSDFFYAPLRRMLEDSFPAIFSTLQVPKSAELVSDPSRHDSPEESDAYFEHGFQQVFQNALNGGIRADIPMTVYYAFKQSVRSVDELSSTGWATILEGLLSAGWMVTATWPVRTERPGRMRANNSNALASSVVLACRPRPTSAGVIDRQGLVRLLHEELPGPLRELQKAHIAPVDLRQAAIGPGMAIHSRFAKVIEADGSAMHVRTALGLINQVLDRVLDEQEQEFDRETRWAIQWFSQYFFDEGPYGIAEQLAVPMDVAMGAMSDSGILEIGGGRVRLLSTDDLPDKWDPAADRNKSVWEATLHLVKRLETQGEASAARLLRRLGALGDFAQLLSYRLYSITERTRPPLAAPFNALVVSWPEIQRLAREESEPIPVFEQQSFDT